MGIIAYKSIVLASLLGEGIANQIGIKPQGSKEHKKVVIDFAGQVMYQSFKRIIDFCYLDDLNVLNGITDSTEMIEVIKLSSHYKLNRLLKAAESYF